MHISKGSEHLRRVFIPRIDRSKQCDAKFGEKFPHFGNILNVFGNLKEFIWHSTTFLPTLAKKCIMLGQIFIVVIEQI